LDRNLICDRKKNVDTVSNCQGVADKKYGWRSREGYGWRSREGYGSKGFWDFNIPKAICNSLRITAEIACILTLPRPNNRSLNALSKGLCRMATIAGQYKALRNRALPIPCPETFVSSSPTHVVACWRTTGWAKRKLRVRRHPPMSCAVPT